MWPPSPYPEPTAEVISGTRWNVDDIEDACRTAGVALLQFDEPLPTAEFLKLGELLGPLDAELDPAVRARVEQEYILNLRADSSGATVQDTPFSNKELFIHTEGSGRPAELRPRYIVLMCMRASTDRALAQTILVPMDDVRRSLDDHTLQVLSSVNREHLSDAVYDPARGVFTIRDPGVTGDAYEVHGHAASDGARAIVTLMNAIYDPEITCSVPWRPGLVAVIDNSRCFHGRTWGADDATRHLKRIRVRRR